MNNLNNEKFVENRHLKGEIDLSHTYKNKLEMLKTALFAGCMTLMTKASELDLDLDLSVGSSSSGRRKHRHHKKPKVIVVNAGGYIDGYYGGHGRRHRHGKKHGYNKKLQKIVQ